MKDSHELARLCTLDLGKEITSDDVRTYLLTGNLPEHLSDEERLDMQSTLLKELDVGASVVDLASKRRLG